MLAHHRGSTASARGRREIGGIHRGDEHDEGWLRHRVDPLRELDAAPSRHVDVGEHQIRAVVLESREALGGGSLFPGRLESRRRLDQIVRDLEKGSVVVHGQHPHHGPRLSSGGGDRQAACTPLPGGVTHL